MSDIPKAAVDAAAKAMWELSDDEVGWESSLQDDRMAQQIAFVREEARLAIMAALPRIDGYAAGFVAGQEAMLDAVDSALCWCTAPATDELEIEIGNGLIDAVRSLPIVPDPALVLATLKAKLAEVEETP